MAEPIELYVHIPFCVKKCAYCDFLSGPADDAAKSQYVEALLNEIDSTGVEVNHPVQSVFFGGGTPSILPGEWIAEILSRLRSRFAFQEDAEITLEANPGTLTEEKVTTYRAAGINRLSLGLQTTEDSEGKILGRIHNYETFLESFHMAREAGFQNLNIDLMSGIPGQTLESYEGSLERVLALKPEHISAYSLILEEGTPLYEAYEKELLDLPEEEVERAMYDLTEARLALHGYHRYEISNYALEGRECRHNLGYWTGIPYIGLGLGASSYVNYMRYSNTEKMQTYLEVCGSPNKDLTAIRTIQEVQSLEDRMAEYMILGLRLIRGISETEFARKFGKNLNDVYGGILEKHLDNGLLVRYGDHIAFTRKGLSLSNQVLCEFV